MKKFAERYRSIIKEINEEVSEGVLQAGDEIQILREEKPVFQDYCEIIDWYYDEYTMKEELETPLEEMYLPEEFSKKEWEMMKKEQKEYKEQYKADLPKLQKMTVKAVLTEMKQMQKLFG